VSIAYLDTHIAIFLHDGLVEELSSAAKREIENTELLISPMVVLEFEYLHARKKISVDARTLTATLAETFGVAVCSFPFPAIVYESLSLEWASDFFDRLIVGHAAANRSSSLITRDRLIRRHYSNAVW
jgi:PIN domain nuclease of toxin-antitoxin system